jgi:exodeoxyribonuclease V beta subunit
MNQRTPFDIFNTQIKQCNLIEASAGTGKTWSLTGLYLRMIVENNLLPENILVVTFTKAATAELNGRIRERLRSALLWSQNKLEDDEDKHFFQELFTNWNAQGLADNIRPRLIQALSRFDKAAIYTIHSFCQRLLSDFAFESGGRFNLETVTDSSNQLQTVANDFWRQHIKQSESDDEWLKWLIKKKQSPSAWLKLVTNFKSKPYQSLIRPNETIDSTDLDGEKKKISTAEKHAIECKESLQKINEKCLTLWQKKSDEITQCLEMSLKQSDLLASGYKVDELENYIKSLDNLLSSGSNRTKKLAKIDIKFSQAELDSKTKKNRSTPTHPFYALMDQFITAFTTYFQAYNQHQTLKDDLQGKKDTIYQVRLQNVLYDLLTTIDNQFPALKSKLAMIDFDDMILNVYQALIKQKNNTFSQAVAEQFQAALIDEFQDTDPLQIAIFDQIFVQTKTPLFYVGDPKQAIYSFRGADIHAYYQAAEATDTKLTLTTNYRSTPAMVDSVNALFSTTYAPFMSDEITFDWVDSSPKDTLVIEGDENALQFFIAQNEDEDAFTRGVANPLAVTHTVEKIAQLLDKAKAGTAYFKDKNDKKRDLQPSDIAILVPRHRDADDIFAALAARGIASVRQGQDKVLESKAAATLLRLVQTVSEPGNESALLELLGDPLVGYQAVDIIQLKEHPQNWENLIESFWGFRQQWLEHGFSSMYRSWLALKGLDGNSLTQRLTQYFEGERHLTDLNHIAEILQQQARYSIGLQPLISWLQHAMDGEGHDDEQQLRLESDRKRIKIVTLHACKGLEYNLVFCPFLWAGKVPPDATIVAAHKNNQAIVDFGSTDFEEHSALATNEALMEQLRLLYVALTRSVHRCYIFWAKVQYGNYTYTANSALAWLLYGDTSMDEDRCEQLCTKVKAMSFDDIVDGVKNYCESANSRHPKNVKYNKASSGFEIINSIQAGGYLDLTDTTTQKLAVAKTSNAPYYPNWKQTSFSGLTKGEHVSLSEKMDDIPVKLEQGDDEARNTIFTFPRGASPGECIHSIFEDWDFNKTDEATLKTLVAEKLDRYAIDKDEKRAQWVTPVSKMIKDTLSTQLIPGTPFCLQDLSPTDRQPEMEFLLSASSTISQLQLILRNPKYHLPSLFVEACEQISSQTFHGFLTGFIDLVFKDNNDRYCVLDWKSNHLGMQPEAYAKTPMEYAMATHHYYLQALIYQVALHRYLKLNKSNYDITQHLGGAWYLFVRGIDKKSSNGIYHFQPPSELITALDKALTVEVSH